jgi:hypothetical protein
LRDCARRGAGGAKKRREIAGNALKSNGFCADVGIFALFPVISHPEKVTL